jgi:hypothetical protein
MTGMGVAVAGMAGRMGGGGNQEPKGPQGGGCAGAAGLHPNQLFGDDKEAPKGAFLVGGGAEAVFSG